MSFAIAIDGPGGAGKSTIAKKVAEKLKFIYIDTGAMYRSVALYCIESFISLNDEYKVTKALDEIDINIDYIDGEQRIFLNDIDVTQEIRSNHVAIGSSKVAVIKSVREKLVSIQRNLANGKNVIMDGRDIGTFVLPNAQIKIYLTASVEVRSNRRMKELCEKGENPNIDEIMQEIIDRDTRDMNREISPLKQAEDAIYLDTSNMLEEEVVNFIINLHKEER